MNESQRDFQKAKIRLAISEELDDRLDQIDREIAEHGDETHEVTEEERRWMQEELQRGIRPQRKHRIRRLAILIAAALLVLLTAVSAWYKPWRMLQLQDGGNHTKISATDDWTEAYEPSSFPGVCSQRSVQVSQNQRVISYLIDDGEPLLFYQIQDSSAGFDTALTDQATPVHTDGFSGWVADNDGEISLYWMQDDYMFSLLGRYTQDELVATALSVQNNEKGSKEK